jgi:hypothetical protein
MNSRSGELMIILCMSAALGGACDPNSAAPSEPTETRDAPIYNGVALNAAVINGWSLNGWSLNGWSLNGWSLNGWSLNGWSLNGVALDGTLFSGSQELDGKAVARVGLDFIGSTLTLIHDDQKYTLRIDDIRQDPSDPEGDVYFYRISVKDPEDGTWSSLCVDADGTATEAIPLANHWDAVTGDRIDEAGTVTFACRGAVLAKCVEWGYRPWASAERCSGANAKECSTISLADHHQACTRMARADYCGEGLPHTVDSTPIDILDALSPRIQSEGTKGLKGWATEAEWGPDGALCVGDSLRLHMLEELGHEVLPADCLPQLELPGCGDFAATRGALLVNKYCEAWIDDPKKCAVDVDENAGKGKGKPKKAAKKPKK